MVTGILTQLREHTGIAEDWAEHNLPPKSPFWLRGYYQQPQKSV